jgi:glutamyl-tRNA synthetase
MEEIKIEGPKNSEIERIAKKYAIKNCYEHGNADVGAVIGKVKAIFPNSNIGLIMPMIKKIVEEINLLDKIELKESYELFENAGWELKQIEKEKKLPELNWIGKEKIITRAAPCPTGAMHFGHARPYILLDEYVKKYGGKYFLRFDDTDPKIKIAEKGIEEEFIQDFKWLGIKIHGKKRQSDNMKHYLQKIEILIAEEKAYICDCKPEEWRKKIWKGEACECRVKSAEEHLKTYKEMKKGKIKEGVSVIRIKTDLKDKDSSTRDWWIAKIVDDPTKHPNKKTHKQHVWPSYNLASSIDDYEMKINFMIRGQEHIQNEKKQKYLYDYFEWAYPKTMYHGKITKVADMVLSKSKIKLLMEKENLERDDDPRLATIKSFRRRGFRPEAIRKVILNLGLNPNDAKISLENFAAANKEIVGETKKYSFIHNEIICEIKNLVDKKINLFDKKLSLKEFEKIILDKNELKNFKENDVIRLKNLVNIKIESIQENKIITNFDSIEKTNKKSFNWIKDKINVIILMSNGEKKFGITEKNLEKGMVYYYNIGYVNIENIEEDKIEGVFAYE